MNIPTEIEEQFRQASARFNKAFDALPKESKAKVQLLIDAAHYQTAEGMGLPRLEAAAPTAPGFHELALAATAQQTNSMQALMAEAPRVGEGLEELALAPHIGPAGEIWWFDRYQQLDPGWLDSAAVWLENFEDKHKFKPFPTTPAHITIPDHTTIALVGDWGTGEYGHFEASSQHVGDAIRKNKPDCAIHLGDVYYAGTKEQEIHNFLRCWVPGNKGSFSLNSNHEMMDGGHGYFQTLLNNEMFKQQKQTSYFALENANWVIVGLDTAYFADKWKMYGPGNLDSAHQSPFLKQWAQKAHDDGKGLIVMSHQNGLSPDGSKPNDLWTQVAAQIPSGADNVIWYWGHEHIGCVCFCC